MVSTINTQAAPVAPTTGSMGRVNENPTGVVNAVSNLFASGAKLFTDFQEAKAEEQAKGVLAESARVLAAQAEASILGDTDRLAALTTEAEVKTGQLSASQEAILTRAKEAKLQYDQLLKQGRSTAVAEISRIRAIGALIQQHPEMEKEIKSLAGLIENPSGNALSALDRDVELQLKREEDFKTAQRTQAYETLKAANISLSLFDSDTEAVTYAEQELLPRYQRAHEQQLELDALQRDTSLLQAERANRGERVLRDGLEDQLFALASEALAVVNTPDATPQQIGQALADLSVQYTTKAAQYGLVGTETWESQFAPMLAAVQTAARGATAETIKQLETDMGLLQATANREIVDATGGSILRVNELLKLAGPLAQQPLIAHQLYVSGADKILTNAARALSGKEPLPAVDLFGAPGAIGKGYQKREKAVLSTVEQYVQSSQGLDETALTAGGQVVADAYVGAIFRDRDDALSKLMTTLSHPNAERLLQTPQFRTAFADNWKRSQQYLTDLTFATTRDNSHLATEGLEFYAEGGVLKARVTNPRASRRGRTPNVKHLGEYNKFLKILSAATDVDRDAQAEAFAEHLNLLFKADNGSDGVAIDRRGARR